MKILALDTSALTATVAVMSDGEIVCEESVTTSLTHSQTIMPMVDDVLKKASLDINDIDLFACSTGPGSFTGLRIGIGTIKGLAYGTGKPVCGISTLEALAYNAFLSPCTIAPIMDARRGQVYNALYKWENDKLHCITEPRALSIETLCASLNEKTLFVGDGVKPYKEKISALMGENAVFAPPHQLLQRASCVCVAALTKEVQDAASLSAVYLRKPQAEREREEKNKKVD